MFINPVRLYENPNTKKVSFASNPQLRSIQEPDTFETSQTTVPKKHLVMAIQEYDKQLAAVREIKGIYKQLI